MLGMAEYINKDSCIHRLHPLSKIVWAAVILNLSLLAGTPWHLVILFGSVVLVAQLGRILRDVITAFRSIFLLAVFVFVVQAVFYVRGETVFYLLPWFGLGRITTGGLGFGLMMGLRVMAIVSTFPVFLATTQPKDLVVALVENLRMPYDYAFMFISALRFIPTFLGEAAKIKAAQQARGFAVRSRNPVKRLRAYVPLAVPLILVSLRRAQQLAVSMETRAYGRGERTYLRDMSLRRADIALITGMGLVLICGAVMHVQKLIA